MIKIFAIGNVLLGDDGIAIRVIEDVQEEVKKEFYDIEVIIGETDVDYCINEIKENDFIIIVDSSNFSVHSGTVIKMELENYDKFLRKSMSHHSDSLLEVLRREYRHIKGYIVAIEISKIDYSLNLSAEIESKFQCICNNVVDMIREIIKEEMKNNDCKVYIGKGDSTGSWV